MPKQKALRTETYGSAHFFYTFSNWWYKALTMQNVAHMLQEEFEAALLVTGLFSLVCWMVGRKLTNSLLLFSSR